MNTNEETAIIRKALRIKGFKGSVRHGRGTAYCWIDIGGTGRDGNFTDEERTLLTSLGLGPGGNYCVIAPEARRYWVLKLTDPENPQIIIEQDRVKRWLDAVD